MNKTQSHRQESSARLGALESLRRQGFVSCILIVASLTPGIACGSDEFAELTGRWGEAVYPSQLVYSYSGSQQTINGRSIEIPPRSSQFLVVVSMTTRCPLAQRAVSILNELQEEYFDSGVDVLGLFTDFDDNVRGMASFAAENNAAFAVYLDDQSFDSNSMEVRSWARRELGMTKTPEVVVLDVRQGWQKRVLIYRGMIDDSLSISTHRTTARREYVREVLNGALAREASQLDHFQVTAPQGCIMVEAPFVHERKQVTYYPTISRLVQEKCERCHRPGGLGAESFMAFESYEDVVSVAPTIIDRVSTQVMPPWHALVPEEGRQEVGGLEDDLTLTEEEIQAFQDWYACGMPQGHPATAPEPREWPAAGEWEIGTPDVVLTMPEPFYVPKERWDGYRYYYLDIGFDQDRFVQAVELRPGNQRIVHHMGAILGPKLDRQLQGTDAMLHFYGLTGDKISKLGDWVPGGGKFNAMVYPQGAGLLIPANHGIVLEMHYTPTGVEEQPDISSIGLIFCKDKPSQIIESKVENCKKIDLPPHQPHIELIDRYWFKQDVAIDAIGPHMHYRGKDYTLFKVENPGSPEEKRTKVISIIAYDLRWQRTYQFAKPLQLKAGDYLEAIAHFDNSHFNPNNPAPQKWVRFGLQSEDEMFNTRFKYAVIDSQPTDDAVITE